MLLIVLGIVSTYVTYTVEPYLDEKFRAMISSTSVFVRRLIDGSLCNIHNCMKGLQRLFGRGRASKGDAERQGLLDEK